MQKSFYPDDILEFKIYHKWVKGNLKDIIINKNKYILSLINEKELSTREQNNILIINNSSPNINNSQIEYKVDQKVEFFDESSNSWIEGTIKDFNNDFYIISYTKNPNLNNSKIIYKNNIRHITNNKDILKIYINNIQSFSLKDFKKLDNPIKYAKTFINKLVYLLNEKIAFIFLNNNFDLFIYVTENENNKLSNKEIIKGLIDIAVKHFRGIDKEKRKEYK